MTKTLDCSNSNSYIATLAGSLKEYYSGRLLVILVIADHIINFIEFRGHDYNNYVHVMLSLDVRCLLVVAIYFSAVIR